MSAAIPLELDTLRARCPKRAGEACQCEIREINGQQVVVCACGTVAAAANVEGRFPPSDSELAAVETIPADVYASEPRANGVNALAPKRTLSRIHFRDMRPHLTDGYLIKGLFVPNSIVGIIGQSGSGKTFGATDMALHIAARRAYRGRKIRGGLVCYAALEGPRSAENRFVAGRESLGFPGTSPLCLTPGPLNLRDPADVALLIGFVREVESEYGEKCVAVFVDTLSRAMAGGDENGSEDMGALIAGADAARLAIGATLLLVHHTGKDETRGARGHSSFKAALDTEIEVVAKDNLHVATVTKQRDLPAGGQFAFRLKVVELGKDEDGDAVTTCVVEPVDDVRTQRRVPSGKNQVALLAALQEWQRAHSEKIMVTSVELREIAKAQDIDRKRLQEAVEGLEKFGWLQSIAGGYRFIEETPA